MIASAVKALDVAIAGETNLDLILQGLPEALPVEVELLASDFHMTLGGSSSILAHNLSLLGARVGFASLLGDDAMGTIALKHLAEAGLDTSHIVRRANTRTGVTIVLPHGSRRHMLTYPGVTEQITVSDLDLSLLVSARHLHLSSLFLQTGLHAGLPQLFDHLRRSGLTLSLDTNDDPSGLWSGVLPTLLDKIDLLLPNEVEVQKIAGRPSLEAALDALAPRVPLIVVKCGARGALVQQGSQRGFQRDWVAPIPIDSKDVIDTIGAGDSFNAGFLRAWLDGMDPLRAAAFGNLAGALSTLRAGGVEAFRDAALRSSFFSLHQTEALPGYFR
jgi:sugar/nucleoside kinase (ribokinase family)